MKLLMEIAALLIMTAVSPALYDQDVTQVSPTDKAPRMGHHWWQHASGEERLTAIAVAIQGLQAGFAFGLSSQLRAMNASLKEAYARGKISKDGIEIATIPRPVTTPTFTKALAVYRSKVDDAYARVPSMRQQPVALVLLCFSDLPITKCPDVKGKELR